MGRLQGMAIYLVQLDEGYEKRSWLCPDVERGAGKVEEVEEEEEQRKGMDQGMDIVSNTSLGTE